MRVMFRCGTAFAALLASTAVHAQSGQPGASATPDAAAEYPVPADPAVQATADEPTGLGDIVVTAQRRSESLQRAAIPVTAVSGDSLVNSGVSDVANLTKLVPSLVVQPSGGSGVNLYLRGVGTLQSNAFAENPIAFNFNGVYVARPTAPVGTFYDLDRIEVVKGPQGTLYGRNATGGAINIIPARPRLRELSGSGVVEYGNYEALKASGALNVPLGDSLALRIAAQVVDRKGYLSDGYDDEVGQAARASLLFAPGNGWSALLTADYFHQGGRGAGSVLSPAALPGLDAPELDRRIGGSDPRSVAALAAFSATLPAPPFCPGGFVASGCVAPPRGDGRNDSTFWGAAATIEGDLGFAALTIQPAYRNSRPSYVGYLTGFRAEVSEQDDQLSLEVRLSSAGTSPLQYVVGAYYFVEDQVASNFFAQGNISTTRFTPRLETDSKAVFGQATYSLADTFRLVGGLRYTDESRSQSTRLASGGLPGVIEPALGTPNLGEQKISKVTWKAGAEFDAGPASLFYANVATGFKAGGFFVAAPPNNTFRPESLTAYTIGAKNRFLGNRVQFNVEAFYWDYRDQQISFVGGISTPNGIAPGGVTVNAGKARMYGAEAELRFAPTVDDILSANVQYLNGRYDSLVYTALSASGAQIRNGCSVTGSRLANPGTTSAARLFDLDCSGRQTINSPEWTANLSYDHIFHIGDYKLTAGARTRIESSRFVTIDYLPEARQGSYTMSDALLTLSAPGDRWALTAFVNNIENETVLAGGTIRPVLQTFYSVLRPPRTYGVRASFDF